MRGDDVMKTKKYSKLDMDIEKVEEWIKFWCEENIKNDFEICKTQKEGRVSFSIIDKDGKIDIDFIICTGKRYTIYPYLGKRQDESVKIAEYIYECINNSSSGKTEIGNGFSIVTTVDTYRTLIELLNDSDGITCIETKKFDEEHKAKYVQYKFKSEYGDSIVIKFFENTNRLQIQGKPLYLFGIVQDILISDETTAEGLVDANIKFYSIDMKKEDLYVEMQEKLGDELYGFLTRALKAILSPAFLFYKIDMEIGNYSCLCQPALQALEGYCLKLLISCGVIHNNEKLGDYFSYDEIKNRYYLNKKTSDIVKDENKISSLNKLYVLYKSKRHQYSHSTERDYDTYIISDREVADSIFREVISAMKTSYENWK